MLIIFSVLSLINLSLWFEFFKMENRESATRDGITYLQLIMSMFFYRDFINSKLFEKKMIALFHLLIMYNLLFPRYAYNYIIHILNAIIPICYLFIVIKLRKSYND